MIAYYTFPRTGKGTDTEPFGPGVPAGFTSWSVVEERKDDFLVAVEADDAYHAARSGKVAEEVIEYETIQVPVARKLIDKRAGAKDAELSSIDEIKAVRADAEVKTTRV